VGQVGGSVEHSEGKSGGSVMAILRFLCGSPRLCRLRTGHFGPNGIPWFVLAAYRVLMGLSKPSSPITTLSNRPSLLRGGLLEGEWDSREWRPGWALLGAKTSSREQRPDFYIVGTSPMVIIHETPGAMRTTCRSGSPLVGCIQFESPWHSRIWVTTCLLLSSCSMFSVLLVVGGWAWLWLCCHYDYFCIILPLTLTWVNILLVYACSSM
jgi:hypothetical protein